MIIKILIIAFILFAAYRTVSRFRQRDIAFRELLIWLIFWCLVGLVTIFPQKTDSIAQWLGVSRGADLLVYISIIVLFFAVFKIVVKQEKIERDITKIIRTKALDQKSDHD